MRKHRWNAPKECSSNLRNVVEVSKKLFTKDVRETQVKWSVLKWSWRKWNKDGWNRTNWSLRLNKIATCLFIYLARPHQPLASSNDVLVSPSLVTYLASMKVGGLPQIFNFPPLNLNSCLCLKSVSQVKWINEWENGQTRQEKIWK